MEVIKPGSVSLNKELPLIQHVYFDVHAVMALQSRAAKKKRDFNVALQWLVFNLDYS